MIRSRLVGLLIRYQGAWSASTVAVHLGRTGHPSRGSFHYHFHSQRIWELLSFHRRCFEPVPGPGAVGTDAESARAAGQTQH